jgi:SAM-dependent methyltransferase
MQSRSKVVIAVRESPVPTVDVHAVVRVPHEVFETTVASHGTYFEPINRVNRHTLASDFLNLERCRARLEPVDRHMSLRGKRMLDIGSGYGTNLATCILEYGVDGYGIEPSGEGFGEGYSTSRKIFAANGIDPDRILNSTGESIPFPDDSFDIVYSANVLEHTQVPEQVLREAMRVLRPGGLLYVELPNFLSYFEGHYLVVQPPILWKSLLPWWVRTIFRRDPSFARTLHTEINPSWCRKQVRELRRSHRVEQVSLGEEIFLKRLSEPFHFEAEIVKGTIGRLIQLLQKLNVKNWVGHLLVALQAHYPIFLTLRKADESAVHLQSA